VNSPGFSHWQPLPGYSATTAFDPAAASVTCEHCGFVQTLKVEVVGHAAAN
jgi:hypothetical protein